MAIWHLLFSESKNVIVGLTFGEHYEKYMYLLDFFLVILALTDAVKSPCKRVSTSKYFDAIYLDFIIKIY